MTDPLRNVGTPRARRKLESDLEADAKARGRSRVIERGKLAKVGGRQMWRTPDGYIETERTITIRLPNGRYANVPSFNPRTGREYKTDGAAYRGARDEGYTIKTYATRAMASLKGRKKSKRLGEELRERGY